MSVNNELNVSRFPWKDDLGSAARRERDDAIDAVTNSIAGELKICHNLITKEIAKLNDYDIPAGTDAADNVAVLDGSLTITPQ